MKIAVLSPISWRTPPRSYGPWEQVSSNIAEGLVENGVDVTLFATADSITKGKLESVAEHSWSENPEIDPKVFECLHISNLMEQAGKFDLIHNNFDFLPLTYSRLIKTPVVTTIHGFSSKKILPVYKKYNSTNFYVSISNSDRSPELDYTATVYNGINTDDFTFCFEPKDYLLFFGRIHPEKGIVPPNIFIPVAEETELIIPIGEWVLFTAAEQLKKWESMGLDLSMNVNLSGVQFRDKSLLATLERIFTKTCINCEKLNIELTESVVMDNAEQSIATMKKIKKLGALLSVDDFGTGYSSLNYLQQLPIDTLKIDRSFINMLSTENGLALVKAILAMSQSLQIKSVAEGIETPQQMHSLRVLNCNSAQGYYFARPMPAPDATIFVQTTPYIEEIKNS